MKLCEKINEQYNYYYAEYNIILLTVEGEMFNILIVISPVSERSLILS